MTITTKKTSTITVVGTHTNKNCKPVFCITTGEMYASVSDAAALNGATSASMSCHLSKGTKTCKGKKFCLVSKMTDYAEEIAESVVAKHSKAIAYDAMMAEKERISKANERLARHREACEKLREKMEAEMKALADAEAEVRELEGGNYEKI